MLATALTDLWYGFGVAFEPQNIMWCFVGVLVGNMVGVLPGLLAGSTLARGSPLKGIAMTLVGLLLGIVGTDIETGTPRFTFGIPSLFDGIELVGLALGLFGIAEFMKSVNQFSDINTKYS